MILVDHELKKLCIENQLVTPYDESLVNPSSIDLRLGKTILLDCEDGFKEYDISNYTKENPFRLKPLSFCLAQTLETVKIQKDNSAEFRLKSSRAREGINHLLACWIDPNFQGVLTLELQNTRRFKNCHLFPGQRIGQMIVYKHNLVDKYYEGKYQNATTVETSKDI